MPSTSLVTRAREWASRVLSPGVTKQVGYTLPLSGGFIPSDWALNWWQQGYNPVLATPSAVVYACVAAYAQTVAMCPGSHWRGGLDNGRDRVTNSALSRILKRPNSYQTISDFLLNLTANLLDSGNAYALAVRNNRFEITELHLMNARISRPRVAPNGDIFYALAGNPVIDRQISPELLGVVPARDVLHVRWECKINPLIGEPPLNSAMLDVAASDMMVRNALAYASNEGRPSGVIETDIPLQRDGLEAARAAWNEQTRGVNSGGTPILTNGLKWKPGQSGGGSSRDGELANMLQATDQRIATAYRMPLSLLSLFSSGGGHQSGTSTESLMQFWIASGLGFCLNHIEEAFGKCFELQGWPDEYLELDTAALERSQFKDRVDALARGVQGGIYSPNEARAIEDLPSVKAGDEPRVQQQVVPLSFALEPPAPPAPPTPPPAPAADAVPAVTDAAQAKALILRAAGLHHARRAA